MRRMHDDKEVVSAVSVDENNVLTVIDAAGNKKEFEIQGGQGGELTPEALTEVLKGSDYVSVDINEAGTEVIVELDETKLETVGAAEDSTDLITSGAVFNDLSGKLDATKAAVSEVGGLVIPSAAPAADKIVGIDTSNGQELIGIGDGLSIVDGNLTAAGGGGSTLYRHHVSFNTSSPNASFIIEFISKISTPCNNIASLITAYSTNTDSSAYSTPSIVAKMTISTTRYIALLTTWSEQVGSISKLYGVYFNMSQTLDEAVTPKTLAITAASGFSDTVTQL